ncbi:MAG: PAS domain-containing methyl-accepting chemotaxis protein [Motiliproteus sp.]
MKKNLPVTQRELDYPSNYNILSTTDLKGAITYINQDFLDVAGFGVDELIGKNHNVVRHPDMPPAAFKDLWSTLQSGNPWMGMVKNRCKNGDHYWVDAFATPIKDNGQTTEYQSVRMKPEPAAVKRAEAVYPGLMDDKLPGAVTRPHLGLHSKVVLGAMAGFLPLIGWNLYQNPAPAMFGALALSLVLCFTFCFLMTGRLRELAADARKSYHDPLMQYIYTGSTDDIGQIQMAMKKMSSELRAVVARVNDSSEQVQVAANSAMKDMNANADGARRQQDELHQVATAVDEMSATIDDVAGHVQSTAQAANEAHEAAISGRSEVDSSFRSIQKLVDEVNNASAQIQELDRHSASIESVLDVIKSVAEQTNLLALNAAIEAARAGEAGRGFAVVADEVRTLAKRTQESTQEIEQQIESLQKGVKLSVSAMHQGQEISKSSVEDMERTGAVFDQITEAMSKISEMGLQVASATEEQSAVAVEISENVNRVNTLSMENLEGSNRAVEASERFVEQARQQQSLVQQFLPSR